MMLQIQKRLKYSVLLSAAVLSASLNANEIQEELDKKYLTKDSSKKVFTHKIEDLSDEELDKFILGKSFFRIPWVEAPSATTARDGLGPLFNANTCLSCHPNNGSSSVYNKENEISRGYISRLSIPSNGSLEHQNQLKYKGFVQDPVYGSQISVNGTKNVPFEAKPLIKYEKKKIVYPDGKVVYLKSPLKGREHQLAELNYGKLHGGVSITNRVAQPLIGLGLLEKLSDGQILENQDINDTDGDGISGKANMVYSPQHGGFKVGRYTWKASASTVKYQSAAAANNDMSLTTSLFPDENCTAAQKECNNAPKGDPLRGGSPFDLPDQRLDAVAFYLKNLKAPKSVIREKKGEELFAAIGCASCHIPTFTLSNGYKIRPFSDLLLHDMGEELSDGRREFLAEASEWRTAPLWGIGKREKALGQKPDLLHDGRAGTIEEAILWHAGEALRAKENFMNLSESQRESIIKYIKEL